MERAQFTDGGLPPKNGNGVGLGTYVERIADDVKTIARDEVELVRDELQHVARVAAGEAVAVLLAALVALIGFCMLCVAGVVALDAVIPSLAIRLLMMAAVFMVGGGVVAAYFIGRLRKDIAPNLDAPIREAKRTKNAVTDTLEKDKAIPHA